MSFERRSNVKFIRLIPVSHRGCILFVLADNLKQQAQPPEYVVHFSSRCQVVSKRHISAQLIMKKLKFLFFLCILASPFVMVMIQNMHIEKHYNVREHLEILNRKKESFCVTGIPCMYSDVTDFRVIVITYKRPDSLSKLLHSLTTLVLDGYRSALEIWIDRDRNNNVDKRTLELASAFRWQGEFSRVHVQVKYQYNV